MLPEPLWCLPTALLLTTAPLLLEVKVVHYKVAVKEPSHPSTASFTDLPPTADGERCTS